MKHINLTIVKITATLEPSVAAGELDDSCCYLLKEGLTKYSGVTNVDVEVVAAVEDGRIIQGVGGYMGAHEADFMPQPPPPKAADL